MDLEVTAVFRARNRQRRDNHWQITMTDADVIYNAGKSEQLRVEAKDGRAFSKAAARLLGLDVGFGPGFAGPAASNAESSQSPSETSGWSDRKEGRTFRL